MASLRPRHTPKQLPDTAGVASPQPAERQFTDASGVRWTVSERRFDSRIDGMPRLLARLGYGEGWLTFRAPDAQYRIGPYPPDWRSLSDFELERWCMRAQWEARRRGRRSQQQ